LRQIAANGGDEPSVVLNRTLEGSGSYGFNAATGQFGDLFEMGIVDPCKVTRTALQNAASIAALVLTTDCMIARIPGRERAHETGGGEF
jgi:chaperonin GroEL